MFGEGVSSILLKKIIEGSSSEMSINVFLVMSGVYFLEYIILVQCL